jgi:thioredoxin-related protein
MEVANNYGIASTPTIVLLGPDGNIIEKYVGHHNGLEDRLLQLLGPVEAISSR